MILKSRISDRRAWSKRFLFGDGPCDFSGASSLDSMRTLSGQQLVENDAKAVNVARGRQCFSTHLFRARVLWRHRGGEGHSLLADYGCFRVEQLGNAEIKQLGFAFFGDQNVRRF